MHGSIFEQGREKQQTAQDIYSKFGGALTRDPDDPWKIDVRSVGIGPLAYQERIRRTLVKFADPDGRIALPKGSRSAGW